MTETIHTSLKPIVSLSGTVIHGKALGRTVGMPTANLKPDAISTQKKTAAILREGVYSTLCHIEGETYLGVTNVGRRPTVDHSDETTIETLLLDFSRDIYGASMTVEFFCFLRPVMTFENLQAVKEQVEKDSARTRKLLAATGTVQVHCQ